MPRLSMKLLVTALPLFVSVCRQTGGHLQQLLTHAFRPSHMAPLKRGPQGNPERLALHVTARTAPGDPASSRTPASPVQGQSLPDAHRVTGWWRNTAPQKRQMPHLRRKDSCLNRTTESPLLPSPLARTLWVSVALGGHGSGGQGTSHRTQTQAASLGLLLTSPPDHGPLTPHPLLTF